MTVEDLTPSANPTNELLNSREFPLATPLPATNDFKRTIRSHSDANQPAQSANMYSAVTPAPPCDGTQAEEPQEYVLDRMISHGINDDQEHPSARVKEATYRVRSYAFYCNDDTSEPIRNILRNKIVSYYKCIQQPLPDNLSEAQHG